MLQLCEWYALQVRTRGELQTTLCLLDKGYEVFSPTYFERRRNHVREIEKPLFPGYLFCRMTMNSTGKIVTTPGVLRIVGYGKKPAPICETEINKVQRIVTSPVARSPWRYLPTGCPVRIEDGPLAGLEGFLDSTTKDRKIVVTITILQRSVAAVLDDSTMVTPLRTVRSDSIDHFRTDDIANLAYNLAMR